MFEVFHYTTTHHIGSQRAGTIQSSEPNEVNVNIINLLPFDSHGTKDCAPTLFYRSLFSIFVCVCIHFSLLLILLLLFHVILVPGVQCFFFCSFHCDLISSFFSLIAKFFVSLLERWLIYCLFNF